MSAAHAENASTLDLPILPAAGMVRENYLAQRRKPIEMDAGGRLLSIRSLPLTQALAAENRWARCVIAIDGRDLDLFLPRGILETMVQLVEDGISLDALDGRTKAMLCELALAPLIDALEAKSGLQLAVLMCEFGAPPPSDKSFAFSCRLDTLGPFPAVTAMMGGTEPLVRRLISAMPPDPVEVSKIAVSVAFRVGVTDLPLADLVRLRPGDGILVDSSLLPNQRLVVIAGERLAQTCLITNKGPKLDGRLDQFNSGLLKEWRSMPDQAPPQPDGDPADVTPVDNVAVRVVFEIGRLDMAVSELQTVGEGHVFDLGKPIGQVVDILSGGRQIGAGELVRVGDRIGVRVNWILS